MTKPNDTQQEHLEAALDHLEHAIQSGSIATGAAKGLLYSVTETLGVLVGDPALPDQLRDGYEGLLEAARELRARLESHTPPR
ncbi:MAG: hypothetical protein KGQ63_02500 [Betaproteobacteria bacterium]|nr:hypothetical protein [Betaproteobacteria bacterium]MDE2211626.1 hypothetical protein [Betaproteobacteria bacterium]